MTRTGNYSVSSDERRQILKKEKPDYCLAIHHNAAGSSSANGFEGFHFNAFSRAAAKMVYDRSMQTGLYSNSKFKSHYFFMCRMTACPTVLTENGYFSNTSDFNNINSDSANNKKAKAMVRGIADYFISIQYTPVPDDTENNSGTASNPVTSTESKPNTSDVSKPTDTTSSNSDIGPITPPTDSSQGGSSEASSRPDDEPDLNDTTSNSVPEPEE